MMNVKYVKLTKPVKAARDGDMGVDLPKAYIDILSLDGDIERGGSIFVCIHTGVAVEFSESYGGLLKFRSGVNLSLMKRFDAVSFDVGSIDSSYRGELVFYVRVLFNVTRRVYGGFYEAYEAFLDALGEYPLQLHLVALSPLNFSEVEALSDSWRGERGFGGGGGGVNK